MMDFVVFFVALGATPLATAAIELTAPAGDLYPGTVLAGALAITDGTERIPHSNIVITAELNGKQLLRTETLHEHDGLWPFAFSAPHPGILTLTATAGDQTQTWTFPVLDREGISTTPMAATADITDGFIRFDAPLGAFRLLDVWDDGGQLRASLFGESFDAAKVGSPTGLRGWGLVAPGIGTHGVIDGLSIVPLISPATGAAPGTMAPTLPPGDCADRLPGRLVLDPDQRQGEQWIWAPHTDVRVQIEPDGTASTPFYVIDIRPQTGTDTPLDAFMDGHMSLPLPAATPWGTFRPTQEGLYDLQVSWGNDGATHSCHEPFLIIGPNPERSAHIHETITVDNDTMRLDLTPRDATGTVLTHVEFDVRILRPPIDDDLGALLWAGKLHGHGGDVNMELSGLLPGDHLIQVFPSAQDTTQPGYTADSDDGFRYGFTVEDTAPPGPIEPAASAESTPALGILPALIGLVAVAVRSRRE